MREDVTYMQNFLSLAKTLYPAIYRNGSRTGTRPTNHISIEFEIRPKFAVLLFKMYSADHNEILRTPRQCNCRDVYKM